MEIWKRVYKVLRCISDRIEKVMQAVSALLVLFCFFTVLLQVINRYVLVKQTLIPWKSISWTDELARFLLVAIGYAALSLCYKGGMLSRADMFYCKLKPWNKKVLYIIETVMILIFLVAAIKYGLEFAETSRIYKSDMLRIPGNILYLIPVVGECLIGFDVMTELVGVVSNQIEPFECMDAGTDDISVS